MTIYYDRRVAITTRRCQCPCSVLRPSVRRAQVCRRARRRNPASGLERRHVTPRNDNNAHDGRVFRQRVAKKKKIIKKNDRKKNYSHCVYSCTFWRKRRTRVRPPSIPRRRAAVTLDRTCVCTPDRPYRADAATFATFSARSGVQAVVRFISSPVSRFRFKINVGR